MDSGLAGEARPGKVIWAFLAEMATAVADDPRIDYPAVARWMAREWELDPGNYYDREFISRVTMLFADLVHAMLLEAIAGAGWSKSTRILRDMYTSLRSHRATRGRVQFDETLDAWAGALLDLGRGIMSHRARA